IVDSARGRLIPWSATGADDSQNRRELKRLRGLWRAIRLWSFGTAVVWVVSSVILLTDYQLEDVFPLILFGAFAVATAFRILLGPHSVSNGPKPLGHREPLPELALGDDRTTVDPSAPSGGTGVLAGSVIAVWGLSPAEPASR